MGKIQNLEDLNIKVESDFMKWVKRIAYLVTILTTLSGGILGILSYLREVKDPKAQMGYSVHSQMLKENSENIRQNREEIQFIYRSIIAMKSGEWMVRTHKRADNLKDTPIQKPMDWKKLPIDKGSGD
jgi:hypothetical protein